MRVKIISGIFLILLITVSGALFSFGSIEAQPERQEELNSLLPQSEDALNFLSFQEKDSIDTTTYTNTTKTVCNQFGRCTLTLYSGITYVKEDGDWIPKEQARSLMGYYNVIYLEEDDVHFIELVDINTEFVEFKFSYNDENLGEYEHEVEDGKIKTKFKIIEEICDENGECYDQETEYEIEIEEGEELDQKFYENPFGKRFKFGENSTTIVLQDADTENLEDGYAREDEPTLEYGARTDFLIKPSESGGNEEQSYIKFNLSSIPAGQQIDDATFYAFLTWEALEAGESITISNFHVYQYPDFNVSNEAWVEGTGGIGGDTCTGNELCWSTMPTTSLQYNTAVEDSATCSDGEVDVWRDWNSTSMVTTAYDNGDNNITIRLAETAVVNATNDYLNFSSKEDANAAARPYLEITYSEAAPNIAPDINITKIDGNPDSIGLPSFSYYADGNLTIDFNVFDAENDRLTVDINYSSGNTEGVGTKIVDDMNLVAAVCSDQDWDDEPSTCNWDFNIHSSLVSDGNYFILIKVSDGIDTDFNASDNNFMVDNTAPTTVADYNIGWQNIDANVTLTCKDSIFLLTDGFEDGDYTSAPVWTLMGQYAQVQSSVVKTGSYAIKIYGAVLADLYTPITGEPTIFTAWVYVADKNPARFSISDAQPEPPTNRHYMAYIGWYDGSFLWHTNEVHIDEDDNTTLVSATEDDWYKLKIVLNQFSGSTLVDFYVYDSNESFLGSARKKAISGTVEYVGLTMKSLDASETTHYFDDVVYGSQETDSNYVIEGSGCQITAYKLDSDSSSEVSMGAWQTWDGNGLYFHKDGNWAIDFNSTDVAGNIETTNRAYVLIDNTAPITKIGYLWNSDNGTDKIYKLNPITRAVISSFDSPASNPGGLAWDGAYLWNADNSADKIYKLNPNTGAVISSFDSPAANPTGLTWDGKYLWNADLSLDEKIYKLNPNTGAVISSFTSPYSTPTGLAWDGNLWNADDHSVKIYKINPTTGAVISSFDAIGTHTQGLAWDGNLWNADNSADKIYKLNPNTGAVISSFDSPDSSPKGLVWSILNDIWYNADINIHLTCYDANSGCYSTSYRIDTDSSSAVVYGPWQTYDTNILISDDGNWAVDYNSTDVAGNIETTNTVYVLIDKECSYLINQDWIIKTLECHFKDETINIGTGRLYIEGTGKLILDNSYVYSTADYWSYQSNGTKRWFVSLANGSQIIVRKS